MCAKLVGNKERSIGVVASMHSHAEHARFTKWSYIALTSLVEGVVCKSPVAFIQVPKHPLDELRALVGNASWRERLSVTDEPEATPYPTPWT